MKVKNSTESMRRQRIQRAVASSAAIETGTPVKNLEAVLKARASKFKHLKLAN